MSKREYIQYNATQLVKYAKEIDLFARLIYARPGDAGYVSDAVKEIDVAVNGLVKALSLIRSLTSGK
jgi:deoxyribose-phosphate aldolase